MLRYALTLAWVCTVILPVEGWFGWLGSAETREYVVANRGDIWTAAAGHYTGKPEVLLHITTWTPPGEPNVMAVLRGDQWGGYSCEGEDDELPAWVIE